MEIEQKIDQGHENLIEDLEGLLNLAKRLEFHDFRNELFATPKMALRGFFLECVKKVETGYYDN